MCHNHRKIPLLCVVGIFLSCTLCIKTESWTAVCIPHASKPVEQVFAEQGVPDQFPLSTCTYHSSCDAQCCAVHDSVCIPLGAPVSRAALARCAEALLATERYTSLSYTYTPDIETLVIIPTYEWVLSRVTVQGLLMDALKYRLAYGLQAGHPFQSDAHERGIRAVKQVLCAEGYRSARVSSQRTYNDLDHTIAITLSITKGKRAVFDSIELVFEGGEPECADSVRDRLLTSVAWAVGAQADHATAEAVAKELVKRLRMYGYLAARVWWEIGTTQGCTRLYATVRTGARRVIDIIGAYALDKSAVAHEVMQRDEALLTVPVEALADDIRAWYVAHGFLDATVQTTDEHEHAYIAVTEGPCYAVSEWQWIGVHDEVRSVLCATWVPPATITPESTRTACVELEALCAAQGYWQARVDIRYEHESQTSVCGCITCDLGPCYTVTHENVDALTACGICILPYPSPPTPTPRHWLELRGSLLQAALYDQGFVCTSTTPVLEGPPDSTHITWTCDGCAYPLKTGFLLIQGHPRLQTLLTRMGAAQRGTLWSDTIPDAVVRSLSKLGIFSEVRVGVVPSKVCADERDIVGTCVPARRIEGRTHGGIAYAGGDFSWAALTGTLGVSVAVNDPLGIADRGYLHVDITRFRRDVDATYTIPFVGDSPYSLTSRLYSLRCDVRPYAAPGCVLYTYSDREYSTQVEYTQGVAAYAVRTGVRWLGVTNLPLAAARALCAEPWVNTRKHAYIYIEPNLYCTVFDTPLDPSVGYALSANAQLIYGPWYGGLSAKCMADIGVYVPLHPVVIAYGHVRAGAIVGRPLAYVHPTERWYVGGPHTVRGYDIDMVPPLIVWPCSPCSDAQGQCLAVPRGGTRVLSATVELQYRWSPTVRWATFLDAGSIWPHPDEWGVAVTTGVGLRCYTICGVLRCDVGWMWPYAGCDGHITWSVGIGSPF